MGALLVLIVGGSIATLFAETARKVTTATDHYRASLKSDPYRNHTLTDPDRLAAAIRRHDRPYLGPRNRNRA